MRDHEDDDEDDAPRRQRGRRYFSTPFITVAARVSIVAAILTAVTGVVLYKGSSPSEIPDNLGIEKTNALPNKPHFSPEVVALPPLSDTFATTPGPGTAAAPGASAPRSAAVREPPAHAERPSSRPAAAEPEGNPSHPALAKAPQVDAVKARKIVKPPQTGVQKKIKAKKPAATAKTTKKKSHDKNKPKP